MAVHEPLDLVGGPFHGIYVEIIGKVRAARQRIGSPDAIATRVTRPMHRSVNNGRFAANVFHDVNFPAGGPAGRANVRAQHPESGPESLSAGDFDARLDASI